MGEFRVFLAGVNISILPAQSIRHLLFNVGDNAKEIRTVEETNRLIKFAKPEITMLDSSGFQLLQAQLRGKRITSDPGLPLIMTKNALNISPFHVVEAACNIQPDILVGLDFPIRKLKKENQEAEYLFKSKVNAWWGRETARLREERCPDIQLFLPIQCYTIANLAHYMKLVEGLNYDGFSMPIRNLKIHEVGIFLARFHQMGTERVHLLGTTSFSMIALSAYFARHFFQWVSLDSATWRIAATHNCYMSPLDLSIIHLGDDSPAVKDLQMICECPFCSDRSFEYIKNLSYYERRALLRSHNWYAIEKVAEALYDNATDILSFEKFLRIRSSKMKIINQLVDCLSINEVYKDTDIQFLESLLKEES